METHKIVKITPETKVPFPCWLWASDRCPPRWMWIDPPCPEDFTFNGPSCIYQFTHYSTNPPDQPPLGEPAPEGSLPVTNAQYTGKHPKDNATGYDDSPLPTPAAPSLQFVAEEPIVRKGAYDYLAAQYRKLEAALTERDERIGGLEKALEVERGWVAALTRDNGVLIEAADKTKAGALCVSQAGVIEKLNDDLTALRTRCEELERDRERLDWAEAKCAFPEYDDNGFWKVRYAGEWFTGNTARAAIRAARKEGQP